MSEALETILRDEVVALDQFFTREMLAEWKAFFFSQANVEGTVYKGRIAALSAEQIERLVAFIRIKTGVQLDPARTMARVRVTNRHDQIDDRSYIHIDPYEVVGIIYLAQAVSTGTQEDQGTKFYRHRATGKIKFDKSTPKAEVICEMLLEKHSSDLKHWEQWNQNPYAPNSAVFFNGYLFHSPPQHFYGESDETGRMTLDLFSHLLPIEKDLKG